jgi:hypothetical protein
MINNIDKILPFLKFESKDDFYYLQILQRKKENPQLGSNSRVIKNYYIGSTEYLLDKYDEMKKLCTVFNARAMIRLNKRSYEKTSFKSLENVAGTMANRDYDKVSKGYDRACGLGHNDPCKKWILDIDSLYNIDSFTKLRLEICNNYQPFGDKVMEVIQSKNGYHIISSPFNLEEFRKNHPEIEVHKDNPTNLYIP